jgi:hypothetical protein
MQSINIQGFTYTAQNTLLPLLINAIGRSGGWLLKEKATSPTTIELYLEIHLRSVIDFYIALVVSGLEFTRVSHFCLTSLCTGSRNAPLPLTREQLLPIRLEISFVEQVRLPFPSTIRNHSTDPA